jgi:hypothetical protein
MNYNHIVELAKTCSPEDLVGLLKGHESISPVDNNGNRVSHAVYDYITMGVTIDNRRKRRAQKKSILADFMAKRGAFAETHQVASSVEEELRANIADLTAQLAEVVKTVEKLSKPASKKAPSGGLNP